MTKSKGTIKELIKYEEARRLFSEYSILIGNYDVVTKETATILFGQEVVDYVMKYPSAPGSYFNCWGTDDKGFITYFYEKGFLIAATYHNVFELLAKRETM